MKRTKSRQTRSGTFNKLPRLVRRISEDRALKLSNDLSENIASGTLREWRAVAFFWRAKFDESSRSEVRAFEAYRIAMATLRDISNLPRGGRHKRLAVATIRLLESLYEPNIGADASSLRDSVRPLVGPDSPTTGKIQNGNFQ